MKHETSEKGDIGVANITADLLEKGFVVFNPINATLPFDLLIFHNDFYYRIQVKYRKIRKGIISAGLQRHVIVNGKDTYSLNKFADILAVYCPDNKKCYYVLAKDVESSISLRVDLTKNNQKFGIKYADNYLDINVPLAQLVEQSAHNRKVVGSKPSRNTKSKKNGRRNKSIR